MIGATGILLFQVRSLILLNLMIYGAFIYIIAIKGMVFKYISLVSEGLTIKEKMSRIATCQTYGIKDEIKMNLTRG